MITLTATAPESLSRSTESTRPPVRVGLVQHRWRPDADELAKVLRDGIDRAAMGSTVIGHGTKIDNLVHIGHNCKIGPNCLIVAQTGISGSTTVGHNVTFGGQVGTVGHIKIGANSVYAARSGIIGDMPEGVFCAGFPVQSHAEWLRMQASMKHLPEMYKKFRQLEKKLAKYESK